MKYLGVPFEHWKICEWNYKSFHAYKLLHSSDDTDYSKGLSKDELVEYLAKKGVSADWNKPMKLEQIKRLGEGSLREIYNNIQATHNLVDISQVHGNDLEIIDGEKSVIEYIMEQVPDMYVELDTGWCNYGGNESCSFIEKYHDRIKLIHLKQLDGYGDIKITELPNGKVIDVAPIVEVCQKHGIDKFIVEQDNTDKYDLESAKINADYLLGR